MDLLVFVSCVYIPIGSFLVGFFADYAWAQWTKASNDHRAYAAANWGLLIFGTNIAYIVLAIEGMWWPIAAYVAGSWLGTVVAVKRFKRE